MRNLKRFICYVQPKGWTCLFWQRLTSHPVLRRIMILGEQNWDTPAWQGRGCFYPLGRWVMLFKDVAALNSETWLSSKKQYGQNQASGKWKAASGDGGLGHDVLQTISAAALQRHNHWIQWDHLRSRKPSQASNLDRIKPLGSEIWVFKIYLTAW